MADLVLVVASGFNVSSAGYISPANQTWSVQVPSMTGNTIRVDFSPSSGGQFSTLFTDAGTDAIVTSSTLRPAWGIIPRPPSSYLRIRLGTNATDAASFTLLPINN